MNEKKEKDGGSEIDHKYWCDMNIMLDDTKRNYISNTKEPDLEKLKSEEEFYIFGSFDDIDKYGRDFYVKIKNLYENSGKTSMGSYTLITEKLVNIVKNINGKMIFLTNSVDHKKIYGNIISIPIRICYGKKKLKTVITTFLCVDVDTRKKGIAMVLIQKVIKDFYDEGLYSGYHMSYNKIGLNSIQLKAWYRGINLKNAWKNGWHPRDFSGCRDQNNIKNKLNYKISKDIGKRLKIFRIEKLNENEFSNMKYFLKQYKLRWDPDFTEAEKWCKNFHVCKCVQNKKILGFFVLRYEKVFLKNKSYIISILMTICEKNRGNEIVESIIYYCQKLQKQPDVIYGYLMGEITKEIIEKNKGSLTKENMWLEFYNFFAYPEITDINLPLI